MVLVLSTLIGCTEYGFESAVVPPTQGPQTGEPTAPPTEDTGTEPRPIDPETGLPELQEGSVRGRVCAPNGTTWVAGAEVNIITPQGAFTAVSNGEGWWQVDGLPPGHWGVVITKGSFELLYDVQVLDGEVTEVVYDECLDQGDLTIAVVTGDWDHIEDVLTELNLQFTSYASAYGDANAQQHAAVTNLLTNPTALAAYDVVFLNCGISEQWVNTSQTLVAQTLRDYVEAGGSIYASDWSYYAVEAAFPEKIAFFGDDAALGSARVGTSGTVNGVVVDAAMSVLLGSDQAELNYDLNQWVAMDTIDPTVETLVEGTYSWNQNGASGQQFGPLAVRFHSTGGGRVIYTSFHNEVQATFDMQRMLEEIVLSL